MAVVLSRIFACGLTLAALGLSSITAYAQDPLSYSFIDLSYLNDSSSYVGAVGGGYAVGTSNSNAAAWNLSTGARTAFNSTIAGTFSTSRASGITNGYVVGSLEYYDRGTYRNVQAPVAWNLSTGARTSLNTSNLTTVFVSGASGGYAYGSAYLASETWLNYHRAQVWDVQTGASVFLSRGGTFRSLVDGIGEGYAVGRSTNAPPNTSPRDFATAWNLASGQFVALDNNGLVASGAYGVTNGYAVGSGSTSNTVPGSAALAWNLATGARTTLDNSGLGSATVSGATNGYAIGNGKGTATGDTNNATAWDIANNTRTNLQATFLPTGTTASTASYVNEDGTIQGDYTVGGKNQSYALIAFKPWQGDTLLAGKSARVTGNVNQTSGTTTIHGEYFFVNGPGQNTYTISGGVLQGSGLIAGNVVNTGGTLALGSATGSLGIFGDYTQGGGGIINISLLDPRSFAPLMIAGNTTLDGILNIAFDPGFTGTFPESIDLIHTDGLLTGTFAQVNILGNVPAGASDYSITTVSNGGSGSVVRLSARAIPETGTLVLMGLSLLGVAPLVSKRFCRR